MPPTGSTFTDWQRVERESRLLIDEDFSWSEPPQRRRGRGADHRHPVRSGATPEPIRASAGSGQALAYDWPAEEPLLEDDGYVETQPESRSHFDEMMEQWNAQYGDGRSRGAGDPVERAFDLSDPGMPVSTAGARRTVVISGRGDERYMPAPRQRRSSELRFHERSSFSPDRAGLWAVLLGVALVIGCIVH